MITITRRIQISVNKLSFFERIFANWKNYNAVYYIKWFNFCTFCTLLKRRNYKNRKIRDFQMYTHVKVVFINVRSDTDLYEVSRVIFFPSHFIFFKINRPQFGFYYGVLWGRHTWALTVVNNVNLIVNSSSRLYDRSFNTGWKFRLFFMRTSKDMAK